MSNVVITPRSSAYLEIKRKNIYHKIVDFEEGVFALLVFPVAQNTEEVIETDHQLMMELCAPGTKDRMGRSKMLTQNVGMGGKSSIARLLVTSYDLR